MLQEERHRLPPPQLLICGSFRPEKGWRVLASLLWSLTRPPGGGPSPRSSPPTYFGGYFFTLGGLGCQLDLELHKEAESIGFPSRLTPAEATDSLALLRDLGGEGLLTAHECEKVAAALRRVPRHSKVQTEISSSA